LFVSKLVKKLWIKGSVCDEKKQSKRNVLTEEKVKDSMVRDQSSQTVEMPGAKSWCLTGISIQGYKTN
jgi:hypothetical protein